MRILDFPKSVNTVSIPAHALSFTFDSRTDEFIIKPKFVRATVQDAEVLLDGFVPTGKLKAVAIDNMKRVYLDSKLKLTAEPTSDGWAVNAEGWAVFKRNDFVFELNQSAKPEATIIIETFRDVPDSLPVLYIPLKGKLLEHERDWTNAAGKRSEAWMLIASADSIILKLVKQDGRLYTAWVLRGSDGGAVRTEKLDEKLPYADAFKAQQMACKLAAGLGMNWEECVKATAYHS